MRRPGSRRRWLVVVALWYLAALFWASRPLSETMQVGIDYTADPPAQLSVTVECNSVFSSTSRSEELPTLPAQPDGQPPLTFPREPCEFVQADARRTLAIDTVVVVLAVVGLLWFGRRRPHDTDEPSAGDTDDRSLVV